MSNLDSAKNRIQLLIDDLEGAREEEIESKPYDNFAKNVLGEALVYLRLAEDSIASIQKHVKSIEK